MQQQYNKHNQKTNATTINTIKKMHRQYSQQLKKKVQNSATAINTTIETKQIATTTNTTIKHSNKKMQQQ